jgi:cyclase
MLATRIIPCLDVKAGRVVKGVNFLNLKDAGDPVELACKYYESGADEITFLDISASIEERKTTLDIVRDCANEIFIPLTVGGGISSVEDVDQLLRAGADKVSINTSAIRNPKLISEISNRFGNQILVLSVDAKKNSAENFKYTVTTRGGSVDEKMDALEWIRQGCELGAGEILLNSMDQDGTTAGFDLEMLTAVKEIADVPVIASGGAGTLEDFKAALVAGADALLAASVFHYGKFEISQVKSYLAEEGFFVRV